MRPTPAERVVGERDEARIGRRGRRGGADRAGDGEFVAVGRSAQAAMKAAAVERLTPAKQWITIGSARSQACDEVEQVVEMRSRPAGPGRAAARRCRRRASKDGARPRSPPGASTARAGAEQRHQRARAGRARRFRRSGRASRREGAASAISRERSSSRRRRRRRRVRRSGRGSAPRPRPGASARDSRRSACSDDAGAPKSLRASAIVKPASAVASR